MPKKPRAKGQTLTFPQTCMTANFYNAAADYPTENFKQIARRMLGPKGFAKKLAAR
jgi:hypothetical protein